jgi:cytochrome c-type biogenesis protein CcmE
LQFKRSRNKEKIKMAKKLFTLLFVVVLALPLSTVAFAQDAPMKMAKEVRWEGTVVRTNPDKSTLTVRKTDGGVEMTIVYDGSTKWVAQYHAAKQVSDIDASQVKEGDRVICKGTWESKGVFKATLISKRLSHPA